MHSRLATLLSSSSLRASAEAEIDRSPDPKRAASQLASWLDATAQAGEVLKRLRAEPSHWAWLARLFSLSTVWPQRLTRDPGLFWWLLEAERIETGIQKSRAQRELEQLLQPQIPVSSRLRELRRWKQREILRIVARDLSQRADLVMITHELSVVAELTLESLLRLFHPRGQPSFAIIGMGKLGGDELNYCSDVDVLFVYGEEGKAPLRRGLLQSHHEFFTQIAQKIVETSRARTEEGFFYRMDVRLRPEGKGGPLTRSVESYENYYAAWGQPWERMALIKARPVAGPSALGEEFLETIQTFRYPRAISPASLEEIAELKARIEEEIVGVERLDRNVKLGPGGIREIEFLVQTQQLLHAGHNPFLQEAHTLRTLAKLARYNLLPAADTTALAQAYRFFRTVEHRLQIEADAQTHTIPDDPQAIARLARALGFAASPDFLRARQDHATAVRGIFARLLPRRKTPRTPTAKRDSLTPWLERLQQGPGYGHVPPEAAVRVGQLAPQLRQVAQKLGDADAALALLVEFADAYGARATLFESFAARPQRLEALLCFFDASRWLARIAIAHPDWLDEAMRPDVLQIVKSADQIATELARFCARAKADNERTGRARLYWEAEMLRIGLRDLLLRVPLPQIWRDLSALAEGIVRWSWPRNPPMAAIALGKFGGSELGYGADLDLMIVTESSTRQLYADEARVQSWLAFLARVRGTSAMFTVDLRLRPEGTEGALVTTPKQFRAYHRSRAEFWERQMLTCARFIAGNPRLGREFLALAHQLTYAQPLTRADWALSRRMRQRIEEERSKGGPERDFKTGRGGIVDVEFTVQLAQMAYGRRTHLLRNPGTLAAMEELERSKRFSADSARALREAYLFLRRVEAALARRDGKKTTVWPEDPKLLTWLARQMDMTSATALVRAQERQRRGVRRALLFLWKRIFLETVP